MMEYIHTGARVVSTLYSHAYSARSGDNSLQAARQAVSEVAAMDADERFVFLLSDANLGRYDVSPQDLADVVRSHAHVQVRSEQYTGRGPSAAVLTPWLMTPSTTGLAWLGLT